MNRRSSIRLIIAMAAAMLSGVAALVVGFLGNAFRGKAQNNWISLGPAEDLSSETFRRYVISRERIHAWKKEAVPEVIYVKDFYPEAPVAMRATCTHLGCTVNWKVSDQRFVCPCHGGVYDEAGQVLGGPPSGPLERLAVKIDGETCYVKISPKGSA